MAKDRMDSLDSRLDDVALGREDADEFIEECETVLKDTRTELTSLRVTETHQKAILESYTYMLKEMVSIAKGIQL